jgi:hypothetical protein
LAQLLPDRERVSLVVYPHGCFCALQLKFLNVASERSVGLGAVTQLARDLHQRAATQGLPLFNSAGFGFAFTAVLGYDAALTTGDGTPVLRIAFGDHDFPVIETVTHLIADVLRKTMQKAHF